MLGVRDPPCREFFFCGTATQVRRKCCCGCLGRQNLLQRHVTSPLGVKRQGEEEEEKEKCSLYGGILALLFLRAFHYAWQRISRTVSLTLSLPLKLYAGYAIRRRRTAESRWKIKRRCNRYFHVLTSRFSRWADTGGYWRASIRERES